MLVSIRALELRADSLLTCDTYLGTPVPPLSVSGLEIHQRGHTCQGKGQA
jgi:hypothetical protein